MSSSHEALFRPIEDRDVRELIWIRTQTEENVLRMDDLIRLGITEQTVIEKLRGSYKGWLCELESQIVGFAIGDSETGEMWVIAMLPRYEGRGIGRRLLGLVTDWLFESRDELWLTTEDNPQNRAYKLYTMAGWTKVETDEGHCKMVLRR